MDALNDRDSVQHRTRRPVPLSHYQDTSSSESVDSLFELGPTLRGLTARLFAEYHVAAGSPKSGDLPVEVLRSGGYPRVADFLHLVSHQVSIQSQSLILLGSAKWIENPRSRTTLLTNDLLQSPR